MIKLVGRISVYNENRSITGFNFWPLVAGKDNFIEIAHFYLETILAHSMNTTDSKTLNVFYRQNEQKRRQVQNEYNRQRDQRQNSANSPNQSYQNSSNANQWNKNNRSNNQWNNQNISNRNQNQMHHNNANNNNVYSQQLQNRICQIIANDQNETGCLKDKILNAIPSQSVEHITETLQYMEQKGLIYSCLDDFHFKLTTE